MIFPENTSEEPDSRHMMHQERKMIATEQVIGVVNDAVNSELSSRSPTELFIITLDQHCRQKADVKCPDQVQLVRRIGRNLTTPSL